jgi:CRP/FNR family transcriptional regulator, cyclic AMP receptor protein
VSATENRTTVRLLDEDPELAHRVPPERRDAATRELTVEVHSVPPGRWSPAREDGENGDLGLLVLRGLVVRSVGRSSRLGAELLGPGDIVRPWQDTEGGVLGFQTSWSVIQPARLARLDAVLTERLSAYPEIVECLVGRTLQRARSLAATMAIAQEPTVEARLELLLWHLADRFGRVRPNGVFVPLTLTHSVLARLVAARRPSTTTALGRLSQRGMLERGGDGWLLHGDPPAGGLEPMAAARAG